MRLSWYNFTVSILEKPITKISIVLVVIILTMALFFYLGQKEKEPGVPSIQQPEETLPELSKRELILQTLSAPLNAASQLQGAEKVRTLNALSVPSNDTDQLTGEEQADILDALSAP